MELSAGGYASFCEVSRDSVRGRIGAEKIFFPPASILQGCGSYYTFQIQRKPPTKQNHERRNAMFGLTALVITLIGTTVVGCGTGFAIVCATES